MNPENDASEGRLPLGGLVRSSFVDYPGKVAAVVFYRGCNLRCPYCHNPELVAPPFTTPALPQEELFSFLRSRLGRLDGVVITGGEPTIHADLPDFIRTLRDMPYAVKLDTNGTNPDMLAALLDDELLDYVAMDVKLPIQRYPELGLPPALCERVQHSISLLLEGNVEYEFRTTVAPPLLDQRNIIALARGLAGPGTLYLQSYTPGPTLDPQFAKTAAPLPPEAMEQTAAQLRDLGIHCKVR